MAGGRHTGGRRSEPYAGSGPAGTAGPPAAGAAGEDHEPPVITAGATGAAPPLIVGAGAPDVGGGVSTGGLAATNAPALGAVGGTGGVANGGPACGGGAAPDSIPCIVPADKACPPAPAGCPVATPLANDCPNPGEKLCPTAAGDIGAPGTPGAAGPPPPGKCTPGGAAGGPPGRGPPLPPRQSGTNYRPRAGACTPGPWTYPAGAPQPDPPGTAPPSSAVAAGAVTSPAATTDVHQRRDWLTIQVILADRLRWWNVVDIEAVLTRPRSGVTADTFSIEDLLRGRHDLVDRVPARVRRLGVAARLDSLYFC